MIARLAYGTLFVVLLPVLLALWAARLDALLPNLGGTGDEAIVAMPIAGGALLAAGLALMAWAMLSLRVVGGGLPMNAFPPPRLVESGPYALVPHPIYVGFAMACFGAGLACGSPAMLFIVAPAATLAAAALAIGHETPDLRRRFGRAPRSTCAGVFAPELDPSTRPALHVVFGAALALIPIWLFGYELIGHLPGSDALPTRIDRLGPIPLDALWSAAPSWLIALAIPLYTSGYALGLLGIALAPSVGVLRRMVVGGWTLSALGLLSFVVVPTTFAIAPPSLEVLSAELGDRIGRGLHAWMQFERSDGVGERNACPSFHVAWALLAAWALGERRDFWRVAGWLWCAAVVASCGLVGMHGAVDLVGGALLGAIGIAAPSLWRGALGSAERVANSWREWRIGPIRIINHGIYAGLAAAVGVLITGALVGPRLLGAVVLIALASLLGAAIWGQIVVGSKTLLRPFGYFGSVLGIGLALAIMWAIGWPHAGASNVASVGDLVGVGHLGNASRLGSAGVSADGIDSVDTSRGLGATGLALLAAAAAVAAPWVQAIGRLRCLVQGCCHGAPSGTTPGIVYQHPKSRVCFVSGLLGVRVHATPLYSIVANVAIGLILARLWRIEAPANLITGAYLLLSGIARFVEESRRGESTTPVVGGLRLYQWFAVVVALGGAALTCVASAPVEPAAGVSPSLLITALAIGLVHFIAMGVDVPGGTVRFSRLQ